MRRGRSFIVFDIGSVRGRSRVLPKPASQLIVQPDGFALIDGQRAHREVRHRRFFNPSFCIDRFRCFPEKSSADVSGLALDSAQTRRNDVYRCLLKWNLVLVNDATQIKEFKYYNKFLKHFLFQQKT